MGPDLYKPVTAASHTNMQSPDADDDEYICISKLIHLLLTPFYH